MSQDNLTYLQALTLAAETDKPTIGLTTASDKTSANAGFTTLIRQNNTIIELCISLSRQIASLETRVRSLEAQKTGETSLEDISKQLNTLTIGKPVQPKGAIRVYKDPQEILKQELDKLKFKDT